MMYNNPGFSPMSFLGIGALGLLTVGIIGILLVAIILVLKGYSLWCAARRGEKGWFIALLIVNTFGILELIYLYFIVGVRNPFHPTVSNTHDTTPPPSSGPLA